MKVEVLSIADCPNGDKTLDRVRNTLEALGLIDVELRAETLRTSEDAARWAFAGSPTTLIDGVDAFPSDGRTEDLACRVYLTESGLAGLPSETQLLEVLSAKAQS